jgi:gas vesicle protein
MNNTTKILSAFAIGAVAGAVLGILFAPDKGSETRKKINEQGRKIGEDLKNKFNEMKEKTTNECQS